MKRLLHFIPLIILLAFPSGSSAQDRLFNYTYQSPVLAPGQRELEVWNTIRWDRKDFYRRLDHRVEFELGLAPSVQTAFYLNLQNRAFHERNATPTGGSQLVRSSAISFSNEWKWKLADPVTDPLGLALYAEYTIGADEIELEPKLIIDRSFGPVLAAFNAGAEFEFEAEVEEDGTETTEKGTKLELDLGASYLAGNGWALGIEVVNKMGLSEGAIVYSALFAGPTISYTRENFWVNVTVLPQLTALKGETHNGLVLNSLERIETRMIFSYVL